MFAMPRAIACALCAAALAALLPISASAQAVFVDGTVVDDAGRLRFRRDGARVGTERHAHPGDRLGWAVSFSTLTVGTYQLTAEKGGLRATESIDVSSSGLTLRVELRDAENDRPRGCRDR